MQFFPPRIHARAPKLSDNLLRAAAPLRPNSPHPDGSAEFYTAALFPTVCCLGTPGDLGDAKQGDPKPLGFPDSRLLSLSAPTKSRASFSLPAISVLDLLPWPGSCPSWEPESSLRERAGNSRNTQGEVNGALIKSIYKCKISIAL